MSSAFYPLRENKETGSGSLVGYFPLGFPNLTDSISACIEMCKRGVDVLELGIPYSDPVMDGLVIQQASEIALSNGFKFKDAFGAIREITSEVSTPVLVMSYWNPVLQNGVEFFAQKLAESGAAGGITPDLIPEEAASWIDASEEHGLDRVFLASPNSTKQRIERVSNISRGFVYAVSTLGVTGLRDELDASAKNVVAGVRNANPGAMVCVGIGISTPSQVARVNDYADGAIVGSAFVRAYLDGGFDGLSNIVEEFAEAKRGRKDDV